MKKKLFAAAALVLILLAACAGEQGGVQGGTFRLGGKAEREMDCPEDVVFAVKEGTVTPEGAVVTLEYRGEGLLTFGAAYSVQAQKDGAWYELETATGDMSFVAIGYELTSGQSLEETLGWSWWYGALPPGRYRVVKAFSHHEGRDDPSGEGYWVAAEFDIP